MAASGENHMAAVNPAWLKILVGDKTSNKSRTEPRGSGHGSHGLKKPQV